MGGRGWSAVGSSEFGIVCWAIRHRKSDKRVVFGFGLVLQHSLDVLCVVVFRYQVPVADLCLGTKITQ